MRHEFTEMFGAHELFVEPKAFRAWLGKAKLQAGALAAPAAVHEAIAAYAQRSMTPTMVGDVAVIDVTGPITYKSSWWSYYFGCAGIQDLQQQFRAALADPAVKTIAFRIDSPGGVVDMMPEFADEVFNARGQGKALIAVADTMVASCAYWLAAQVEILYATTSAQIGAIGVYREHDDISGMLEKAGIKISLIAHGDHKVDGNPYEPLSDSVRAELQANVDEIGGWFDAAVARGRGVSKADVLEKFGQGKVFRGKQAITLGLADKAGTFGQVLSRLTKGRVVADGANAAPAIVGTASARPTSPGSRQNSGCQACSEACPCDHDDECPVECPECDPDCSCSTAKAKASTDDGHATQDPLAAADELAALL
jgi:signal peptide peptidase SppA